MGQSAAVELIENERFDIVGCEWFEVHGVGDAASDIVIDAQAQLVDERGLGNEQQVVGFWKILKQEPELAQAVDVHEVGVVNDGDELFAFGVGFPCGFDELLFAPGVSTFGFDAEGFAFTGAMAAFTASSQDLVKKSSIGRLQR